MMEYMKPWTVETLITCWCKNSHSYSTHSNNLEHAWCYWSTSVNQRLSSVWKHFMLEWRYERYGFFFLDSLPRWVTSREDLPRTPPECNFICTTFIQNRLFYQGWCVQLLLHYSRMRSTLVKKREILLIVGRLHRLNNVQMLPDS